MSQIVSLGDRISSSLSLWLQEGVLNHWLLGYSISLGMLAREPIRGNAEACLLSCPPLAKWVQQKRYRAKQIDVFFTT